MNRGTAVAAVALAAALLAGCGATSPAGTVAVVGGARIGYASVQARVAELRSAAATGSGDATGEADGLARRAVAELVLDALLAGALADHGLTVTDGEVAAARAAERQRLGGEEQLERALIRQGVPAGRIDTYYRRQLAVGGLAAADGQDAGTPSGQVAVRRALAAAAGGRHVRINPRYGSWDAGRASLAPDAPLWLTAG
ncbi:SurA N-terminal domain-containing protein [Kitasatospora sp. NPDC050543]|uniref:SurA N-terminal domain-containing protein n=1 Tax=Kitasatospora sp. NPDC050543 TaxID=3364054 RepID=UPI0037ABC258